MNAQIWYVVLLSVTVIAALIGTSIVLGQSKNGPGEDHYIDLDPQMQGEPYATPGHRGRRWRDTAERHCA